MGPATASQLPLAACVIVYVEKLNKKVDYFLK